LGREAGGLYQPKLSKHEKQLMQQAHERHKANITTKQVLLSSPALPQGQSASSINQESTSVINVLGNNWDPTDSKLASINLYGQKLAWH